MKLEIITTGNEILDGRIINTNASWLSERVFELGHEVIWMMTVGDDREKIQEASRLASGRADVVLVSGGLGPTSDDITIEAAASAFDIKLKLDEAVLGDIKEFFRKRGREFSPTNKKQALIPEGGVALINHVGTAPGIRVKLGGATFFFMPGVPAELFQIFNDYISPWLQKNSTEKVSRRVLRCFGIPESQVAKDVDALALDGISLSYRVPFPEILLTLTARLEDSKKAVDDAAEKIHKALGDVVYSEEKIGMPDLVMKLLADKKLTLSVAESCTGGMLSSLVTDIAGASHVFERGLVTYSNAAKEEMLGIPAELIAQKGAVSSDVASLMAKGIRERTKTDFGIGITGIAGPGGETKNKPIGLVYIALAKADGIDVSQFNFPMERTRFKRIVAYTALNMLRVALIRGGNR
ncbi:MAG: competence/damage-inducible protein A [Pseudomonadota bacterium]